MPARIPTPQPAAPANDCVRMTLLSWLSAARRGWLRGSRQHLHGLQLEHVLRVHRLGARANRFRRNAALGCKLIEIRVLSGQMVRDDADGSVRLVDRLAGPRSHLAL